MCNRGACFAPDIIGLPTPNGDVGDSCRSSEDCFSGLECIEGQCSANDVLILAGPGESCLGPNVVCAPSLMCNRGACVSFTIPEETQIIAAEGESCIGPNVVCAEGLMCNRGACFAPIEIELTPLAGLNENCEGFNVQTGEPFPDCAEPFVCEEIGENFGILGANKVCTYATGLIEPENPIIEIEITPLAGLDENCEGFNVQTGEPFPDCAEPFVCEEIGENFGILGANKICTYATGLIEPPTLIDPISCAGCFGEEEEAEGETRELFLSQAIQD